MIEVKVTMKDGGWGWINPVVNVTIDNGHHEYDFKPEDIKSIEIYEVEEIDGVWERVDNETR